MFAALAEFERSLIHQRTKAVLTAARARGWAGERKLKLDEKQVDEIKALLRDLDIQAAHAALWRVSNHSAQACGGPWYHGGSGDDQKRKNPPTWAGFSYYRMSSGGGFRPLVPWLVIQILRPPGGYVKQPEIHH